MLRPYMSAIAGKFAIELTAEILRFAQYDNSFFWGGDSISAKQIGGAENGRGRRLGRRPLFVLGLCVGAALTR
jgi:hypothetical protein